MRTIKLNSRLLVTVFYVLVSFIVPTTAFAEDVVCPCFNEQEVIAFASHPANLACVIYQDEGVYRFFQRGPIFALFDVTHDAGEPACQAHVVIGKDPLAPKAVLIYRYVAPGEMSEQELDECWRLAELGDPPECDF